MTTIAQEAHSPLEFVTTRWTKVLNARGETPEARVALGELCEAYWVPIYNFIRQSGYQDDTARELTQGFIAQLLTRDGLGGVEPSKGRFRSYLLGAVKHFLSDQRDRASARKRGGGQEIVPLDHQTATSNPLEVVDPSSCVPDSFFDRQWAFNLLERGLKRLESELTESGKRGQFESLKPWLVGDAGALSQEEAARQLGVSEGAVKVAIHRLRKRFRTLMKEEIAHTVGRADEVQEELRYLIEALAQHTP